MSHRWGPADWLRSRFGRSDLARVAACIPLVGVVLMLGYPALSSSSSAEGGVVLTGVPTGVSSDTNPEIHVSAPGAVAYRYRINNGPYSDERPISTPIVLGATVRFGDQTFTAGTGDLPHYTSLLTADATFSGFLDAVALSSVTSQVHVTYLLNRIRSAVQPENVLDLWGPGVETLSVALLEKTPTGPQAELSALAV